MAETVNAGTKNLPGRLRVAVLAAIARGPAGVLPGLLASLFVAGTAAALILTRAASRYPQPGLNQWVRGVSLAVAVVSLLGGLALLVRRLRAQRWTAPGVANAPSGSSFQTAALLTLGTLALLALIPVYLLAARTGPPSEVWIAYGFLDKRWLVATFVLGTLGSILTLAAMAGVVDAARTDPGSWRQWLRAVFEPRTPNQPSERQPAAGPSWRRRVGLIVLGLALATYFFGPPWHVDLNQHIDGHETPLMGGVQAVASGATPYIGSAAIQYGPGAELIPYIYLTLGHSFDVESLRQSTVLLFWLAAAIYFTTICLRLPLRLALITCLVSVVLFPTLQLIRFDGDGSVEGLFGWANALRYVGVFAVAMLFPAVAAIDSRRRALLSAIPLGMVWGLTAYVAQENLIGVVVAVGALSLLLAITQTLPVRRLLAALAGIGAGFIAVALVVLAFYAATGDLSRFLELYFLLPRTVASGYSNTSYLGGIADAWGPTYYLLPFFLGALCLLSLIRLNPLRLARQWAPQRVLLVSALLAAVVAHAGALTRADSSHLMNTMIALPVVVTLAVAYLPSLLGVRSAATRSIISAGIVVVAVVLMPLSQLENAPRRLWLPLEARISYDRPKLESGGVDPGSVAASRIGSDLLRMPGPCCSGPGALPMGEFAALMNRMHALLGDRRTDVASFNIGTLYPGAVYFLADLRPAPTYLDRSTMAVNERILDSYYDFYRRHLDEVDAVVTVDPGVTEVALFEQAYPDHRTTVIPYGDGRGITILTR